MKGMTLDEAIIYNEELREGIDKDEMPNCHKAIQLGIEALKETKRLRKFKAWFLRKLLPGESEK